MAGKLQNRLNDLDGREWLYWTDTLYITAYPPDATHPLRKKHGAMKPPEVMAEIIRFFTKKGELVLDPFAGVGGTLLGAALTGRPSLGFELDPRWVDIYRTIQRDFVVADGMFRRRDEVITGGETITSRSIDGEMRQGDCLELLRQLAAESIAAVITDPPYGINHGARGFPHETNFNMTAAIPAVRPCSRAHTAASNIETTDPGTRRPDLLAHSLTSHIATADLGQAPDLVSFLERLQVIGGEIHRVLQPGRYLVILVGDRYQRGEYVPLGFLVAQALRQVGFKFKGVRIWSNKATRRPLKPYAVKSVFVPNITHQNILILRKE
ncbi:DNA methyltransferase [Moorella naiadis]|uniref:DNA methyltransferase n=1 Tax=Moorella naiadis (nom. illeg.) TaxID=3093670 RepID=UPI003D9CAAAE